MCNLANPPQQYSKRQTRAEEIEKCPDEGLEPNHHSSIFDTGGPRITLIFGF